MFIHVYALHFQVGGQCEPDHELTIHYAYPGWPACLGLRVFHQFDNLFIKCILRITSLVRQEHIFEFRVGQLAHIPHYI